MFARNLLAEFEDLDPTPPLYSLSVSAIAHCLNEVDRLYGRDTADLGAVYQAAPLAENSLPALYHNGLRTRVALAHTTAYMHWANKQAHAANEPLPYESPEVIFGTLIAAGFDDLIFTGERGTDEDRSRLAATAFLQAAGAPNKLIEAVDIAIEASKFDELTGAQKFNPALGAAEEQRGSLIGDLWALGTPQGTANTFLLVIENLWKKGPPINKGSDRILYDLAVQDGWQGNHIEDFFTFIQINKDARIATGNFFKGNGGFLLHHHRYPDDGVNALMAPGKIENATLQQFLGEAIIDNRLTISEAFQCALAYARLRKGWEHQTSVLLRRPITPDDISNILLSTHTPEEIAQPVPAAAFFTRYMHELSQQLT